MNTQILTIPAVNPTAVVPYLPPGSPYGWAAVSAPVLAYYGVIPPICDAELWGHDLLQQQPAISQSTPYNPPIGRIDKALAGAYAGQLLKRRHQITQTKLQHLVVQNLSDNKPIIATMTVPPFNTGHALLIFGYHNNCILYSCPHRGNQAASFDAFYHRLSAKRMAFSCLYLTKQPGSAHRTNPVAAVRAAPKNSVLASADT